MREFDHDKFIFKGAQISARGLGPRLNHAPEAEDR